MSVLEKAQELTVRARTYSDGARERDERTRIGTALADVARALTELRAAAEAYRTARDAGVPVHALTVPADLVTRSSDGLPSSQALVAARRRVAALSGSAREALDSSWRDWAQAELDTANFGRVSRLGIQHRHRAEDLQRRLRSTVTSKKVVAEQIDGFCRDLSELEQMLTSIREDDPVVLLLNRIRKGHTTLADLTDEEIGVLRADPAVAVQVFLQTT